MSGRQWIGLCSEAVCLKVECVCVCACACVHVCVLTQWSQSVEPVRRLQGLFLFELVGVVLGKLHLSTNQRAGLLQVCVCNDRCVSEGAAFIRDSRHTKNKQDMIERLHPAHSVDVCNTCSV